MSEVESFNYANMKYYEQYKTLLSMGFESAAAVEALETVRGDLEAATSILIGEPASQFPNEVAPAATEIKTIPKTSVVTKKTSATKTPIKSESKDKLNHYEIMASYKVHKCKDKTNHDKRFCPGWHSRSDRRRNPFENAYTCIECPNSSETVACDDGDNCVKAHNMIERMFHPELFKISRCQRGPHGSLCERGTYCAFAHSDEDHRVPLSQTLKKSGMTNLSALSATPEIVNNAPNYLNNLTTTTTTNATTTTINSAHTSSKSEYDSSYKSTSSTDIIQDKLFKLIQTYGNDGILSSEVPKRYYEIYNEKLEITDDDGDRLQIKSLLNHPYITVIMHKGIHPKYIYDDNKVHNTEHSSQASTTSSTSTMNTNTTTQSIMSQSVTPTSVTNKVMSPSQGSTNLPLSFSAAVASGLDNKQRRSRAQSDITGSVFKVSAKSDLSMSTHGLAKNLSYASIISNTTTNNTATTTTAAMNNTTLSLFHEGNSITTNNINSNHSTYSNDDNHSNTSNLSNASDVGHSADKEVLTGLHTPPHTILKSTTPFQHYADMNNLTNQSLFTTPGSINLPETHTGLTSTYYGNFTTDDSTRLITQNLNYALDQVSAERESNHMMPSLVSATSLFDLPHSNTSLLSHSLTSNLSNINLSLLSSVNDTVPSTSHNSSSAMNNNNHNNNNNNNNNTGLFDQQPSIDFNSLMGGLLASTPPPLLNTSLNSNPNMMNPPPLLSSSTSSASLNQHISGLTSNMTSVQDTLAASLSSSNLLEAFSNTTTNNNTTSYVNNNSNEITMNTLCSNNTTPLGGIPILSSNISNSNDLPILSRSAPNFTIGSMPGPVGMRRRGPTVDFTFNSPSLSTYQNSFLNNTTSKNSTLVGGGNGSSNSSTSLLSRMLNVEESSSLLGAFESVPSALSAALALSNNSSNSPTTTNNTMSNNHNNTNNMLFPSTSSDTISTLNGSFSATVELAETHLVGFNTSAHSHTGLSYHTQGSSTSTTTTNSPGSTTNHLLEYTSNTKALQTQLLTLQNDVMNKTKELELQNQNLIEAMQMLRVSEERCTTLQTEKETTLIQWKLKNNEILEYENKLRLKNEEINNLKEVIKDRESALARSELTKNSLIPELKQLRNKIATIEGELDDARKKSNDYEKMKSTLSAEIDSLKNTITILKQNDSSTTTSSTTSNTSTTMSPSKDNVSHNSTTGTPMTFFKSAHSGSFDMSFEYTTTHHKSNYGMKPISPPLNGINNNSSSNNTTNTTTTLSSSFDNDRARIALQAEVDSLRAQLNDLRRSMGSFQEYFPAANNSTRAVTITPTLPPGTPPRTKAITVTLTPSNLTNSTTNNHSDSNTTTTTTTTTNGVNSTSNSSSTTNSSTTTNNSDDSAAVYKPVIQCSLQGCELDGLQICTGCYSVGYCSAEHQKEHWKIHGKFCAGKK